MPISNGMKKDARAMLTWLETPGWSGLERSLATWERETLETSARLYSIAIDAQGIGNMLQQKMHVDGVVFQDVLDGLANLSPDLSPEEQRKVGGLVVELETAKSLEAERKALQVGLERERAKNETLTQTNAELTQTNAEQNRIIAELVASGRRVGAAATEVTEASDKKKRLARVAADYAELTKVLKPALGRPMEFTEWKNVSCALVAHLMVCFFGHDAYAETTLEKVLRDHDIHKGPDDETDGMRTERRKEFIKHCKYRIEQHLEGAEAVREL